MTNSAQHRGWISKIRLATASAALTLAVVLLLGAATTQSAQARTFTVLHSFTGSPDGANPYAGLIRDAAGNFYGTTSGGGTYGDGTVFKLDMNGTETVLYSFAGGPADGAFPVGGVIMDQAGNLYGTTESGGSGDSGCDSHGCGTVFEVDTNGKETVLHSFAGGTTDGCFPYGGLLLDKAGNFYGTTTICGAYDWGTVFKVTKNGKETLLYSFCPEGYPCTDGASPAYTSLLMDEQGTLYGVTNEGGTSYNGAVYKLSKSGTETVLHSFAGGADGCHPYGTPAMDKSGNLYGATWQCGSSGYGMVWKVSNKGTETVLYNFAGGSDGKLPLGGVVLDGKGSLYGCTEVGGSRYYDGSVYKLSKAGTLTKLHNFTNSDGTHPMGGRIWGAKGTLYGTSFVGGNSGDNCNSDGCGTVWKLTP